MPDTPRRVIALGFFDGVHKGHGALLQAVTAAADRLGAAPCAFTFDRHPDSVITGQAVPLLSTVEDRIWLMRRYYHIQEVVVASFSAMQRMDWEDFISQYLARDLGAVHIVAGHDFHFGYMGKGNPDRLRDRCAQLGLGCDIIGKVEQDGITISSTYIRTLIAQGEIERANQFLGHPHTLTGTVRHGRGIGSSRLFPTANLTVPPHVLVPSHGVYVTRAYLPDGASYAAVTNVGTRPTVNNGTDVTVEASLLDFEGDLYGQTLRLEFFQRLRDEMRFDTLDALRSQIAADAEATRQYFETAK